MTARCRRERSRNAAEREPAAVILSEAEGSLEISIFKSQAPSLAQRLIQN
jgi:hypothetical protein